MPGVSRSISPTALTPSARRRRQRGAHGMRLAYQTNTWGGVVGHPAGVTSIKDLYYLTNGSTEEAIGDIAAAGYKGFELFDGNLMQFQDKKEDFQKLLVDYSLTFIGV